MGRDSGAGDARPSDANADTVISRRVLKSPRGSTMCTRRILSRALLWVLSLFVVASVVKAQVFEVPRPLPEPRIVSGPDFGFRIESEQGGTPIGRLVVRVDGKWIEARVATTPGARPVRPE